MLHKYQKNSKDYEEEIKELWKAVAIRAAINENNRTGTNVVTYADAVVNSFMERFKDE